MFNILKVMSIPANGVDASLLGVQRGPRIWVHSAEAQAKEMAGELVAKSPAMVMEVAFFLNKLRTFASLDYGQIMATTMPVSAPTFPLDSDEKGILILAFERWVYILEREKPERWEKYLPKGKMTPQRPAAARWWFHDRILDESMTHRNRGPSTSAWT